mmetsp:Transcript_129982/g.417237  ORF Transcript_129982/g.417237 Transcript_129982/m.417237 type:complete len:214 (+) Transcript_129982:394-1035(+)
MNIKKSLSRMMSFDRPTAMRNGAFWKGCSVQLPMLLTSMAPKAASMPRPCKTPPEHNSGTKMPTGRHTFVMSINGSAARKTAACRSAGPSTRRTSERAIFRTASPMAGALDSRGARAMKLATKIKIKKFSCRSASNGIGPNPGPKRNSTATRPTVIGRTPWRRSVAHITNEARKATITVHSPADRGAKGTASNSAFPLWSSPSCGGSTLGCAF